LEQLNIVGKRSGDSGFVAHKATLVNALSRVLADRIMVGDFTVGRKGFLGYVKALAGAFFGLNRPPFRSKPAGLSE